jgi:hypothetical protein
VGTAAAEVVIDPRFNGPPDSGHGGYCAGRAAALVAVPPGGAVEVTLRRPVPLATPLRAEAGDGDGVALASGGELVMTARPVPAPAAGRAPVVGLAAAQAAVDPDRWGGEHPFPTCFGCGPDRDPADALCLFAGRAGDGDRFAVTWTPADWAGRDGIAAPEFVWAAADCPSAAPAAGGDPVVLGRLTLALDGPPVPLGRPTVVESWTEGVDGRKHHTAVVLHDGAGTVYAHGRATWIAVPR